jgi:Transposase DDE domain group 1
VAPSTLGTFLRAFTFGHVRQLDRVLDQLIERAWATDAGPGDDRLVLDVDSFVGETYGLSKQGARFGYTRARGYHPILAVRADTGEVIHIRLRTGSANTSRGTARFLDELIARVERTGQTGPKLLRADSGFWSNHTFSRLERAGWEFSIGIRLQPAVRQAIEQIPEDAWVTLEDYPPTSIAQIAETKLGDRRLVVRRVRTLDRQGQLLPTWELFAFLTNRTGELTVVEAEHRQHAVVELAIRDLKDQVLAHFPSGHYFANAAWTVIAAIAHNLLR